jgi:hypothetical protein
MITSKFQRFCAFTLPSFAGDQLYMHPIELDGPLVLPAALEHWIGAIDRLLKWSPIRKGIAFVTIDQRRIEGGTSHRRPGPHVDGNFIFDWGGGGWLTGENGRVLGPEDHRRQYCSPGGGFLIASDFEGCRAWIGEFDRAPLQGGNCEHIKNQLADAYSFILKPNVAYWGNSTGVHESLPLRESFNRSLLRITLPPDASELM